MATKPRRPSIDQSGAARFVPADPRTSLPQLREASQRCRGCELYRHATQAVLGELLEGSPRPGSRKGASGIAMMLVGEQPGDQEDIQGRPFVGPAGKLLDRALAGAGIDRKGVYITNAVKHFKWTPAPRGKRRLHKRPSAGEVTACRPWLEREILLTRPRVIVCLGATAAGVLLGSRFRVTASRGREVPISAEWLASAGDARCLATVHPSAVLRAPDSAQREREYRALVEDLRAAAALIDKHLPSKPSGAIPRA